MNKSKKKKMTMTMMMHEDQSAYISTSDFDTPFWARRDSKDALFGL